MKKPEDLLVVSFNMEYKYSLSMIKKFATDSLTCAIVCSVLRSIAKIDCSDNKNKTSFIRPEFELICKALFNYSFFSNPSIKMVMILSSFVAILTTYV